MISRRNFLYKASSIAGILTLGPTHTYLHSKNTPGIIECDLAIIGGGTGGVAAAIAALRNGLKVVLTEETDWIGGQLTQQAVPPDEHQWIEKYGATESYREFRNNVRQYYRDWYDLTEKALNNTVLNPGNCSVSRICHEPGVAHFVLASMLADYSSSSSLQILLNTVPTAASISGDSVDSILLKNILDNGLIEVKSPWFIDATELGDLLPITKTEYVSGSESKKQTGEPHAFDQADPKNVQAITWCFAMDYVEGEDHTIPKPDNYSFWKEYVPNLSPPWPGKMLSWIYSQPITLAPTAMGFDPRPAAENPGFWSYRRLIDPKNFKNSNRTGITLVNWPMNDYIEGTIFDLPAQKIKENLDSAKLQSLSLLYWMQTEAPREDGGQGWPGLRLRKDITGTSDGLAKHPYVRESRRIKAEFTITENHVGKEARMQLCGPSSENIRAETFKDSVGIGSYRIDLHPSTGGNNYIDIASLPFEISLGSLIPERMENLLAGAKNIGTTHITNGCYRLHPVEWNVGESAGMLVAFCHLKSLSPRQIRQQHVEDFQTELEKQGIEYRWPE